MEIYLLRHGIAEDPAPGTTDADRALTAEGRKKLRTVMDAAFDAGVCPALVITSPLRRAVQTAEIAIDVLEYKGDLLRSRVLRPEAEPQDVWEEIRLHRDVDSL